jgi:hypothetical protein
MWVLNVSRAYPHGAGWARHPANRGFRSPRSFAPQSPGLWRASPWPSSRQFVARFALIIQGPRLRNADVCSGAFFLYCFYVTTARAVKYVELWQLLQRNVPDKLHRGSAMRADGRARLVRLSHHDAPDRAT